MAAPKIKTINNRPLTGYMLLGLALEYVEAFQRKETPVILQSFERVVSIESERFVEQLYSETIAEINSRFDFEPKESDPSDVVQGLETVYPNAELDNFYEDIVDNCDIELSNRLQNILSVKNLVEVRNDLESRIFNYYEQNIKE